MSIGRMSEFKLSGSNWNTYISRFEQYFIANKIEEELKVNTLLAVVGEEMFELMIDLCNPDKPEEITYEAFFRLRKQEPGESLAQYSAALKKLAKTCQFGDSLEDHLTDQFLYGLRSDSIRQQLFTEKDLNYIKAVRIALNMEAAEKNSLMVEEAKSSSMALVAVHKVSGRGQLYSELNVSFAAANMSDDKDQAKAEKPEKPKGSFKAKLLGEVQLMTNDESRFMGESGFSNQ
ncbi:unnamed protein product [Acanthoscelides obtectus]|uniref:Retrotransposon gag domain-containing protein n=1 Tax=Acanthoscelides obtectus TaxID=200917 RepID=A0A9P0L5Z4_ACAOB|nr:unnamed protein product [Acanthoscelides obtectus]CAK1646891.1 hypothetical protein AOBTE_LOCUS14921 [Acanthoscelides obtectus]